MRIVTAHILVETDDMDEAIDTVHDVLFSADEGHVRRGPLVADWTTGRKKDWMPTPLRDTHCPECKQEWSGEGFGSYDHQEGFIEREAHCENCDWVGTFTYVL